MRLALKLGIKPPGSGGAPRLPYSPDNDNLTFDAPLLSLVVGQHMNYLRGWQQYDSCVKGFNALGMLAEHALRQLDAIRKGGPAAVREAKRAFLESRRARPAGGGELGSIFTAQEIQSVTEAKYDQLDLLDVALWKAYAARPISCSTSSNMGISLHQALRNMQKPVLSLGRPIPLLNEDEGGLVIWCPDERADFMNPEKTEALRSLETEQPPLTALHTYINRKERDPGALKDALTDGGYFFPTNPQSEEEMQNLFFIALNDIARERKITLGDVLQDAKVRVALGSLNCEILMTAWS